MEPFSIGASGVGAFPKLDRPKLLWFGADEGSQEFCELEAAIEQKLASMGFRGENRQFVPHLTLGRVGPGGDNSALVKGLFESLANFAGGQMFVDEVIVYASEPQRSGPKYVPLAHLKLGEGRRAGCVSFPIRCIVAKERDTVGLCHPLAMRCHPQNRYNQCS